MGVLIGVFPGGWLCEHSEYCQLGKRTAAFTNFPLLVAGVIVLFKLVLGAYNMAQTNGDKLTFSNSLGVAILFAWRIVCKRVCYFILPPIYRAFNLPHRKFEIGARTYKSLNRESIHPIPSVLDLRDLGGSVAEAERVGIQSSIDLHEHKALEQEFKHRGTNGRESMDEKVQDPVFDAASLLVAEEVPLRYDVDIVTKLIVYAGIGFLAVYPNLLLFQACGLSS